MEHLIKAFRRVQNKLDDPRELLELFERLENDPSSASAEDRIRLLDLPSASVQRESIAAVTTLTKSELLKRAAESPTELSEDEINFLRAKYWHHAMDWPIDDALMDAVNLLEEIKENYSDELCDRLARVQGPLYDESECKAFENADLEYFRRAHADFEQDRQDDLDVVFEHGKPWLQRLWQEDKGATWGYAVFENPQFVADPLFDAYKGEQGIAIEKSLHRIVAGLQIGPYYSMQPQTWPSQIGDVDRLHEIVDKLRQEFKHRRNEGILPNGLLRNVFLYLDHESASSVLYAHAYVDNMWMWAVDPDHTPDDDTTDGYKGYFRVSLKQLVDNFYVARRWQSEISMKDLWKAAQGEPNTAFASMEPETPDKFPLRTETHNLVPGELRPIRRVSDCA
ncbi:hypothetical protein N7532_002657 [Penicillium argentinense]|uniref:Uncharacterized protein n=1 Tax=Penicillium argentinense TaxID=1131581 RepID=A0A9W9KLQ9_9EURO|nr:uncharacterized protein N7532_002657 [Penicillium argentinense]KAJ5110012.1 hypothetical protein N7532_002657 [Penicillium argentinense]